MIFCTTVTSRSRRWPSCIRIRRRSVEGIEKWRIGAIASFSSRSTMFQKRKERSLSTSKSSKNFHSRIPREIEERSINNDHRTTEKIFCRCVDIEIELIQTSRYTYAIETRSSLAESEEYKCPWVRDELLMVRKGLHIFQWIYSYNKDIAIWLRNILLSQLNDSIN